jgi:hypothetical protein
VRATLSRRPCSLGSGYEVVWNAAVCIKALQTAENVLLLTDQVVEKVGWRAIDGLTAACNDVGPGNLALWNAALGDATISGRLGGGYARRCLGRRFRVLLPGGLDLPDKERSSQKIKYSALSFLLSFGVTSYSNRKQSRPRRVGVL